MLSLSLRRLLRFHSHVLKIPSVWSSGCVCQAMGPKKVTAADKKALAPVPDEPEPQADPAAKKARTDNVPVPIGRVAVSKAIALLPGGCPCMPAEADIPRMGTKQLLKKVVPWVLHNLPKMLKQEGLIENGDTMQNHMPLQIQAGTDCVTSFKEVWNTANCDHSLTQSNLYEAGGNLCWVDPEVVEESPLPMEDPPLSWVLSYIETAFAPEAMAGAGKLRIRFPVPLECYVPSAPPAGSFPTRLCPLAGHALLYAWYIACWKAMIAVDIPVVRLLYEAALTTTLCIRVATDISEIAEASAKYSERVRQESQVVIDSFFTFASKVALINGPKPELKEMVAKNLRFNNGLVNSTMLKTISAINTTLTSDCKRLIGCMDREFDRSVLSLSYNKIRLLLLGTKNDGHTLEWCLQTMLCALRRKEYEPAQFTVDTFSKGRDGTPSWIAVASTQRVVIQHLGTIISNLEGVNSDLAGKLRALVLEPLANPLKYDEIFKIASGHEVVGVDGDQVLDAEPDDAPMGSAGDEFMAALQEKLPRGGILFAEIVRKVYDGTFEMSLGALAKEAAPEIVLIDSESTALGDLGKDLRELLRVIHASDTVVSATSTSAPKATLRELVRHASDGRDEDKTSATAEREELWRRAVTYRKKWVNLYYCPHKTQAGIAEVLKKSGCSRDFKGVVNESHRAYIVSGDLLVENKKDPWASLAEPPAHLDEFLKYVICQRGPYDVVMTFDGLNRSCRHKMEEAVLHLPASAEVFLVFDKQPTSWCARKHLLGSRNTEVGYIALPTSRTKLSVQPREGDMSFCGAGEDTSHFTSYTGIPMIGRNRLALIQAEQKRTVFRDVVDELPEKWTKKGYGGVPLFWNETKSADLWARVLQDCCVKCAVDLSPGSGQLAESCLRLGIQYVGIVFEKTHFTWLSNVIDRASVRCLTQAGSVLYEEDLATHLKALFADVVETDNAVDDLSDAEFDE